MNAWPGLPVWPTWLVVINEDQEYRIHARTSTDAMTMGGDLWRAEHTGGQDLGQIRSIDVKRIDD